MTTPKWKNDSGVIAARNAADSADADVRVNSLKVTGGSHPAGYIFTTDVNGLGAWAVNPAIAAAAAAQATADDAVSVNTSQAAAITAAQSDATTALANAAAAQATANAATPNSQLPNNIFIDSLQNHLVAGSGLVIGVSGSYQNNHASVIGTPANGDSWDVTFLCAAGTYLLRIVGTTNTNCPKTDVYIDGNLLTTFDWYSNPAVLNVTKSVSTGALSAGRHTLKMTVNGRNALNTTGWQMPINYYLINP